MERTMQDSTCRAEQVGQSSHNPYARTGSVSRHSANAWSPAHREPEAAKGLPGAKQLRTSLVAAARAAGGTTAWPQFNGRVG